MTRQEHAARKADYLHTLRGGSDATVENHSSIALVRLHTRAARDWVRDNVQDDASYFGGALAVEPRYIAPLVEGMIAAGLVIA